MEDFKVRSEERSDRFHLRFYCRDTLLLRRREPRDIHSKNRRKHSLRNTKESKISEYGLPGKSPQFNQTAHPKRLVNLQL